MNNPLFPLGTSVIKAVMKTPVIAGAENIEEGIPAIFVSNHLGYYAPLKLYIFANRNYTIWAIHELTERQSCKEYLKKDFVEPVLHLKGSFGDITAGMISPICVSIMKHIRAIPVYRKCKETKLTMEQSVDRLGQGESLLIFPESPDEPFNQYINKFLTGFVCVAKLFYERTGGPVNFYPVCVNKQTNHITFGKKIPFDPANDFKKEKPRIIGELTRSITAMFG